MILHLRSVLTKALKVAVPIFAVLVLLFLIAWFSYFNLAGQYVLGVVTRDLPGEVRAGKISQTWSGVSFDNVRWFLKESEPAVEVERIELDISYASLLQRDWLGLVREVRLIKPGVRVVVSSNGELNFSSLWKQIKDAPSVDLSRLRTRIEAVKGWIVYNDRRDAGFLYQLSDWQGKATFDDGERVLIDTSARSAQDRHADIEFKGSVNLASPGLEVDIRLKELELLPFAGYPGFGPGLSLISGTLGGSAVVQGQGETWPKLFSSLFVVGKAKLAQGLFSTPWLPFDLKDLNGEVSIIGKEVSSHGFSGSVGDLPFEAKGRGTLGPAGAIDGHLKLPRFPLARLKVYLDELPEIKGEVAVDLNVQGTLSDPSLSGRIDGFDLSYEGRRAAKITTNFLKQQNVIHLSDILASTDAGVLSGDGWIFLGTKPKVSFSLTSDSANPSALLAGVADEASFKLRLLGSLDSLLCYGRGELRELGSWARGAGSANADFIYAKNNLVLLGGRAIKGSSAVDIPIAAFDVAKRRFEGVISAKDFSVADLPGFYDEGISGRVSGRALVSLDLSEAQPELSAQGRLSDSSLSLGGLWASDLSASFSYSDSELAVAGAQATIDGGKVSLSGLYDVGQQSVSLVGEGDNLALGGWGTSGERARVIAYVSGKLEGDIGARGFASSKRGRLAFSGFQRERGQVGAVAWFDGATLQPLAAGVSGTLVAGGSLDRLLFDYNASLVEPRTAEVGPLELSGSATLADKILTIKPTLLTLGGEPRSAKGEDSYLGFRGEAYPFFGPRLAKPLEKVAVAVRDSPRGHSLVFSGDTRIDSGSLNLNYDLRLGGFEDLASLSQDANPDSPSFNELLPFQVVSGFGSVKGRIGGTLTQPEVAASYFFPWMLLARGFEHRQSISSSGAFHWNASGFKLNRLALSSSPFDFRLVNPKIDSWELAGGTKRVLAARGRWDKLGGVDLNFRTAGLDVGMAKLLLSSIYHRYLPYGYLASDNLRLLGGSQDLSLSGGVRLLNGGVFAAGSTWPLRDAHLELFRQGGVTNFNDLVLEADGLKITGRGSRSADGQMWGELVAKDLDLSQLHRLGGPIKGLSGRADLITNLLGRFPLQPRLELAVRGSDLVWNPSAVGGEDENIPIEELAIGHMTAEGDRLVDGLLLSYGEDGQVFSLPEGGLRFKTASGGLVLEAQGSIRFPNGSPELSNLKSFSQWSRYLSSSAGPEFGYQGRVFRLRVDSWTLLELARLWGKKGVPYQASGAGAIALQGQWWRDHQLKSTSLPNYSLNIDRLRFEGSREGISSGFQLADPVELSYQREGNVGFLDLGELKAELFSTAPLPTGLESKDSKVDEPQLHRGEVRAGGKLALTQLPDDTPVSSFHFGATDIPLENLAFLLPSQVTMQGLVEKVDLSVQGLLPSPALSASALISKLSVGAIREMTLQGSIDASQQDEGYKVSLGGANDSKLTLTFGEGDADSHQMTAQGNAILRWSREKNLDPSRLSFFASDIKVSPDSPLDLALQVVDKNLRLLADAIPGKDVARGDFAASFSVNGSLGYPQFEGKAKLSNGEFISEHYGEFRGLKVEANVERITRDEAEPSEVLSSDDTGLVTRFKLPSFEGTLGKKPFFASGQAEFAGIAPTFLKMFFVGEDLPLRLPELFSGRADVDLELHGKLDATGAKPKLSPVILGTLSIPEGDFQVPLEGGKDKGKVAGLAAPLDYDITVDLGKEFYAHAMDSRIRATGELRMISDQGKPKLYGQLELSRGEVRIPFYDASFRVRQGMAYFEGSMIPRLEAVEAVADLGSYRVIARVEGTYPDRLSVNLFSDPPLPQAELSRLVVLGGLPSQLAGSSDPINQAANSSALSALTGTGVSFLSGILTNRLTEQIGRIFLLSEVSFDYIPPASYVIKLAKALDSHDSFLLTLTRVIRDNGINENLYGIEWRLSQTLLTRFAIDQFNQLRFWIQSINRF